MRRLALGVALLLTFLLIPGSANASALKLVGGSHTFHGVTANRCDMDGVTVSATAPSGGRSSSVIVANIANGCLSKSLPLQVWIWDSGAHLVRFTYASAVVLGTSGTVTVAGNQFTPGAGTLEARVMIGSWPIPSTWVPPVAPAPALACTVTGVVSFYSGPNGWTQRIDPPSGQTCSAALTEGPSAPDAYNKYSDMTVKVSTTSSEDVQWALTMNFAGDVFRFVPVGMTLWSNVHVVSSCSEGALVRLQGDAPYWNYVSKNRPQQFRIRSYSDGPGDAMYCPAG